MPHKNGSATPVTHNDRAWPAAGPVICGAGVAVSARETTGGSRSTGHWCGRGGCGIRRTGTPRWSGLEGCRRGGGGDREGTRRGGGDV